jgi:acetyltransferase
VLQENRTMIEMCRALGFSVVTHPDDATLVNVSLHIADAATES